MLKLRRNGGTGTPSSGSSMSTIDCQDWKPARRYGIYLLSGILISVQWNAGSAFSCPPLPPPRGAAGTVQSTVSFLFHPPLQTTQRRQFQERQGNDNDDDGMYDGGEIHDTADYDGEYDFDLFDDSSTAASTKSLATEESINSDKEADTVNNELFRWFEDRNQIKPILLTDLLYDDDDNSLNNSERQPEAPPLIPVEDFVWFEPSLREIEVKYDKRRERLELSLDNDRLSLTPRIVPVEANAALVEVLQEEMENEIRQKLEVMRIERKARIKERKKLLKQQKQETSNRDLVEKAKLEFNTRDPILANATDFPVDQEEKLTRKQALYVAAQALPTNSKSDEMLDFWAIDRVEESLLERMGRKRNRQQIIDKKVKSMRDLMELKVRGDSATTSSSGKVSYGAFQPDDYADWKKYQEIKAVEKEKSVDGVVNEALVRQKLMDYKEFMARQEVTLQAFHEEEKELQHELDAMRKFIPAERKQQPRNFTDVVADINRKALRSLEQVLEKRRREDEQGTDELEERIAKLRESLEAVNYVDVKFVPREKKKKVFKDEPIDFSEVFPSQASRLRSEKEPSEEQTEQRNQVGSKKRNKRSQEFADLDSMLGDLLPSRQEQVPMFDYRDTPDNFYYSSDDDIEDFDEEEETSVAPPPPKTAFFSSLLDADNTNTVAHDDVSAYIMSESDINKPTELRSTSLLGTFEEQRMKNLFRQAGATTEEEQERLKTSMEEFQRYQEQMMKKYEEMDESDLGYDIADVLTDDGDIDSEKVLSFIKAKPVVPRSDSSLQPIAVTDEDTSTLALAPSSTDVSSLPLPDQRTSIKATSNPNAEEIVQTVNAGVPAENEVEGSQPPPPQVCAPTFPDSNEPPKVRDTPRLGTYQEQMIRNLIRETGLKDKSEQEKFKDEYEKFQQYQEEALQRFEEEEKLAMSGEDTELDPVVSPQRAEQQPIDEIPLPQSPPRSTQDQSIIELGPKPSAAERKRRLAQGGLWKKSQEVMANSGQEHGSFLGQMEVGSNSSAEEVDLDDNEEENEEDFEENQRLIEKALGVRRSKGIDIYDALGRRPGKIEFDEDFKRDEYAFPLRRNDVDLSSYQSRKAMMLERKSISIMEVNSLMDMKDNLEVEGISPYMARVNKPFKEFGAIFRLEGVLVDISTLQYRAWCRVAANVNMKGPSQEDARLASVQNAEYAVSRIFHWTSNYVLCREIAAMHSRCLTEEVKAVLENHAIRQVVEENGSMKISSPKSITKSELSDPDESESADPKVERQTLTKSMYKVFAKKHGFRPPTESELEIALQLPPQMAAEHIFDWINERTPIASVLSALKQIYESERLKLVKLKQSRKKSDVTSNSEDADNLGDHGHLKVTDGAICWIKALLDVEMPCGVISYLDDESVELIMETTGLANLIPRHKRVTSSSGYDRDTFQQLGACLRIDRRPDMCVVFDGNADALNAARDNEMKSVGMTSVYPSYELLAADMTARNFDYLTAMNVRRLFGGRENQEPLLQVAIQEPSRPKRKLLTMYPDDERVAESGNHDDDKEDYVRYDDDKYFSRRTSHDNGVIYEGNSDSDLFQ